MKHLTVYYNDQLTNSGIKTKDNIYPLIQGFDGNGLSCFIIKNTSDKVVNDILIEIAVPSTITNIIEYALVKSGMIPSKADFIVVNAGETISAKYDYLMPGEAISLFVSVICEEKHIKIDIANIPLDITYNHSNIIGLNLTRHFEFSESLQYVKNSVFNNSYTILDSHSSQIGTCTDGISGLHIIKGDGYAYFTNDNDIVKIDLFESDFSGSIAVFVKGIFSTKDTQNDIFGINNEEEEENYDGFTIGFTTDRKLFFSTPVQTVTSIDSFEDIYGEHTIGISLKAGEGFLTFDGSIIKTDAKITDMIISDTPLSGNNKVGILQLGPNAACMLSDVVFYNEYKTQAFHKHIAKNL